jgi:hypothetical protein
VNAKAGLTQRLPKRIPCIVFAHLDFLSLHTRDPHFFLDEDDEDEAAAIIPPATSPTSPKAPVMIAMPIIPSAFKNHQVMLTVNSSQRNHKQFKIVRVMLSFLLTIQL